MHALLCVYLSACVHLQAAAASMRSLIARHVSLSACDSELVVCVHALCVNLSACAYPWHSIITPRHQTCLLYPYVKFSFTTTHTLTEVFSAYMHKHSTYSRGDTRSNKPNVSTITVFYKCRLSYLTFRIAAAICACVFVCRVQLWSCVWLNECARM